MIVTFSTKSYADITMFGDVAKKLLGMMGHSGTIPSALAADDVPVALEQLRAAIAAAAPDDLPDDDFDGDPIDRPVGIAQRAFPLIELLEAATAGGHRVMWE
ncbi:MAG: DUF1840 domain-containing protein [Gammaproteobacteria bacterium]